MSRAGPLPYMGAIFFPLFKKKIPNNNFKKISVFLKKKMKKKMKKKSSISSKICILLPL
jgi:hypothetical protein